MRKLGPGFPRWGTCHLPDCDISHLSSFFFLFITKIVLFIEFFYCFFVEKDFYFIRVGVYKLVYNEKLQSCCKCKESLPLVVSLTVIASGKIVCLGCSFSNFLSPVKQEWIFHKTNEILGDIWTEKKMKRKKKITKIYRIVKK